MSPAAAVIVPITAAAGDILMGFFLRVKGTSRVTRPRLKY